MTKTVLPTPLQSTGCTWRGDQFSASTWESRVSQPVHLPLGIGIVFWSCQYLPYLAVVIRGVPHQTP